MKSYPLGSYADCSVALVGAKEARPADAAVKEVALATRRHMEEAFTRKAKVIARLRTNVKS